ncbi:hypothetical protein NtRootA1_05650 [Arthrobacter sp. NtRootA1]|nr:hypothetical protein NtRootA1_05650 [Arthrobacter sp. NtRootA1]
MLLCLVTRSEGNIRIKAVHTPEHLSFLVTDGAFGDQPGYQLSGCSPVIWAGRTCWTKQPAAWAPALRGQISSFASLRDNFLTLPDYVQVHPAHGASSDCGKELGAIPSPRWATNACTPGGAPTWEPTTSKTSSTNSSTASPTPTPTSAA